MRVFHNDVPRRLAEALEQIRQDLADSLVSSAVTKDEMIDLRIKPESLLAVAQYLRDNPRTLFDFLSLISAVDLGNGMETVYHLHSLPNRLSLRLKVAVDAENLQIDSVAAVWPTANWHEREAFDLFGIVFKGHPDLRRILLDDDFQGHPMRKSYPQPRGRQPIRVTPSERVSL